MTLLTPDEIKALREIVEESVTSTMTPFIKDVNFYIGITGLLLSFASFWQAKKAKEAAARAALSVKRQSTIIEILEITQMCQLELDINLDYTIASNLLGSITRRIKDICGYYVDEKNIHITEILKRLNTDLDNIRTALNNCNPVLIPNQTNIPYQIYYSVDPLFSNLLGNLGQLKGILDNNNIHN